MGALTTAFTFVWMLNLIMFMAQATIINIGPDEPIIVYNCSGTIMGSYSGSGCSEIIVPNSNDVQSQLGLESSSVEERTGIVYIDVLLDVKNWFADKIDYISKIALAPYTILSSMGLPSAFVGGISVLWYGLSIFLLLAFIFGRNV